MERDLPKSMERDLPQSMERDLPKSMEGKYGRKPKRFVDGMEKHIFYLLCALIPGPQKFRNLGGSVPPRTARSRLVTPWLVGARRILRWGRVGIFLRGGLL